MRTLFLRCFFPVVFVSTLTAAPPLIQSRVPEGDLLTRVALSNTERDGRVHQVRSLRRYTLHNARWSADATADVLVTIPGEGIPTYEIQAINARGIQKEILKKILDGEMQAAAQKDTDINPTNYEFRLAGSKVLNGRECQVIDLIPRRRTKYLLDGWACVDMNDMAFTHVEGRTAKGVSFWVGRPYISQDFRKVGDFWYSAQSRSKADVKLLGSTELTIDYLDYSIEPKQGKTLLACISTICAPAFLKP